MVGKIDHFFIFLILKLNSKIQKILLTAKSDILLFFILLLLLENEKNEIISDSQLIFLFFRFSQMSQFSQTFRQMYEQTFYGPDH